MTRAETVLALTMSVIDGALRRLSGNKCRTRHVVNQFVVSTFLILKNMLDLSCRLFVWC